MLIGNLSLIGTPFFSGFYSKDSIIEAAKYSTLPGSGFAYFAVLASVFVTAFYAFRQYFMVFHGEEKWRSLPEHHDDHHGEEHHGLGKNDNPHESPLVVTLPLILLAIPSVIIGYVAIEPMLYGDFFKDVIFVNTDAHPTMHIMKRRVPRRIGNGVAQPAFACTLPCYCRCLKRMAFVRQTAAPACENCTGVPSDLRFV